MKTKIKQAKSGANADFLDGEEAKQESSSAHSGPLRQYKYKKVPLD